MLIQKPTNFVKAGVNIKSGDIVRLLTEGEWKEIKSPDNKTKKVLQFEMSLPSKEIKTYTMNNTTIDNLSVAYGEDSKNWMNKDLRANVVKQMAFGKPTNVLILTPPEWTDVVPPVAENESK